MFFVYLREEFIYMYMYDKNKRFFLPVYQDYLPVLKIIDLLLLMS